MPCLICTHSDRDAIEQALDQGQFQRAVADTFHVPRSALQRHQHAHRPGAASQAPDSPDVGPAPAPSTDPPTRLTSLDVRRLEGRLAQALEPEPAGPGHWRPSGQPIWLAQATHQLDRAYWDRNVHRDLVPDPLRQAQAQATVDRLETCLAALTAREATLREALAACGVLIQQWQTEEERSRRAHWRAVRVQLALPATDVWTHYALAVLAHESVWAAPHSPGGGSWDYQYACQLLQEEHPYEAPTFDPPPWWTDIGSILNHLEKERL